MSWIYFLITVFLWLNYIECENVRVTVEEGVLVGERLVSSYNKTTYYSFKGIPYAQPPVKELRFKAPLPPLPYEGEKDATEFGPMCAQRELGTNRIVGSEDCLYLNVYTPDTQPETPLPVIIFIPGTLYRYGSGDNDLYGPDYLVNYGVILVTINYRLGSLGFLCLDIEDVPGNAGLKDQVLAMQWVQRNIEAFGGDPNQVTIFGQGAGAASVSLHLVSPLSSGLFIRAILSSGNFNCQWSAPVLPVRRAFALGSNLGYTTEDPEKLKEFLTKVSLERLVESDADFLLSDTNVTYQLTRNDFTPVREIDFGVASQFMTRNPVDLIREGRVNNADLLIGHTQYEGLYNTYLYEDLILDNYPYMYELLVPTIINVLTSPAENLMRGDAIKEYYFGNDTISLDTIEQFIIFYSTSVQSYPIHEFVDQYPQDNTRSIYFYHFNVLAARNYYYKQAKRLGIRKATLGDDLPYLFDGKIFYPEIGKDNDAEEYVDLMCRLCTNFVKYGNPTPEPLNGITWPQYGENKEYVFITNDGLVPTQVTSFVDGPLRFWRDLHAEAEVDFRDLWEIP